MELADPKYYNRLAGDRLRKYGVNQLRHILDFYGKQKQNRIGKVFNALIDYERCMSQFEEWKIMVAMHEAANCVSIESDYERCVAFYAKSRTDYIVQYDQWLRVWTFILEDHNQSMSLERLFSHRNKIQTKECSGYTCEGLSQRLRGYTNSATPGTVDSVLLCFKAWKYWGAKTGVRGRTHSPKVPTASA